MDKLKNLVIGLLAHVDSGKTTLSEAILYLCGNIRQPGRVDNGNTFLDNYSLEKKRGITIFSKQARIKLAKKNVTILDTPGHIDFSAEMERTLQVLDYGILIISGTQGVQQHTKTLWKLLKIYKIPTFIFVNKMDRPNTDTDTIMRQIKEELDDGCIMFDKYLPDEWSVERRENIATFDEIVMEKYLQEEKIYIDDVKKMIWDRKIFPCYFGSALKIDGIKEFLEGIELYTKEIEYPQEFGAKVYKIARDEQGNRLTYMKITGGSLKVKDVLGEEKVNQIRIYSGKKFETVSEINSGEICAVTGLEKISSGQGVGIETDAKLPILEPVLIYKLILKEDCDKNAMYLKMKQLEEEEPELHIVWNEKTSEIQVKLMGEVQIEILKYMISSRYGIDVDFGTGNVVYKETISNIVEGIGHFEPLKHYAEVHLLLEPGKQGSGIEFAVDLSEDKLDKNWQKLILTHLEEKVHKGVLTGSDITDMKITLIAGKAHMKHTEGGDFRQATYRAVRQGLMQASTVLLEPFYEFKLYIPLENVGRAMTDIEKMSGKCNQPDIKNDTAVIAGIAPVSEINGYQTKVISYTKGKGRIFTTLKGYYPCHNTEEVVKSIGYDAMGDIDNPSSSIFCMHGAGYVVEWNEVENYMHIESTIKSENLKCDINRPNKKSDKVKETDEELNEIFERTYGPIKRREINEVKVIKAVRPKEVIYKGISDAKHKEKFLLVDGYNIIFAWEELNGLAQINLDAARDKLIDILSNYQSFVGIKLMVVFDAYKVKGFKGEQKEYNNILVVFTKEAQTADAYIERFAHENGKKYDITVATSDGLEQIIISGQGCMILSAREFREEVKKIEKRINEVLNEKRK